MLRIAIISSFISLNAQEAPDPREVYVRAVRAAGSGCPTADSVQTYVSPDAQAFTLIFSEFSAQRGPNIAPMDARKFCKIVLDLHIPGGYQFTVLGVDYEGYASLESGVLGLLRTTYNVAGNRREGFSDSKSLRGPTDRNYILSHDLGIVSDVWTPCGEQRALNLNTDVSVSGARGRSGLMTVDSIEGEFRQEFAIQWRRCRR